MKFLALLAALYLVGCAGEPSIEYRTVSVAVPVPCKVEIPSPPVWATETLSKQSTMDQKTRALMAERRQKDGYITELLGALRACQ